MVVGNVIYQSSEYPALKDFYQKVNAKDKEPAVLQLNRASSSAPASGQVSLSAGSAAVAAAPGKSQ
jgi:hypothetical protein